MFFKLSNGTDLDWPLDKKGWLKTNEGFESTKYSKRKMTMRIIIAILLLALCFVGYKWYQCSQKN